MRNCPRTTPQNASSSGAPPEASCSAKASTALGHANEAPPRTEKKALRSKLTSTTERRVNELDQFFTAIKLISMAAPATRFETSNVTREGASVGK